MGSLDSIMPEKKTFQYYRNGIVWEEEGSEDEEWFDSAPGDKLAYRYNTKKKKPSKPNGFSAFVRNCTKEDGVPFSIGAYTNPKYSTKWKELPAEQKKAYKEWMKTNDFDDEDGAELAGAEVDQTDAEKELALALIQRTRGREVYEDLLTAKSLYNLKELEDRTAQESMVLDLRKLYRKSDFLKQTIFVMNCIPLSRNPNPLKALHAPLELYLTSFRMDNGISDLAWHRFFSVSPNDLYKIPHHPEDTHSYKWDTMASAWTQAHENHMIPYESFDVRAKLPGCDDVELARPFGWELYAREQLLLGTDFFEAYAALNAILEPFADEHGKLPPVFTSFTDQEMVADCLAWLKKMALSQKDLFVDYGDIPPAPRVFSLEHLLWHVSSLFEAGWSEIRIEEAFNKRAGYNPESMCAYHAKCVSKIQCARAELCLNLTNLFDILAKMCGLSAAEHRRLARPAGFQDDHAYSDVLSVARDQDDGVSIY